MSCDTVNIMIVDDNISLGRTMSNILKRKGYSVIAVGDGIQALEFAKQNKKIDVVFMDIKMPGLNGVETFKQLKELLPKASVVMMTAYAVEDLIQEAMHEGAYGVIYKPLDFDELSNLIKKVKTAKKDALFLVIDDDLGTRTTFEKILKKKGFSVITAETGEEGIKAAHQKLIDVLFIDMKLPTINGLETYLRIKEEHPNAVAVIITGYSNELSHLVEQVLLNCAYSCLQKPLDMAEVFRIVDEILIE
jgi:DNA-binding NtrC family response regulator